jgi:hypothetical protein
VPGVTPRHLAAVCLYLNYRSSRPRAQWIHFWRRVPAKASVCIETP